MNRTGLLLIGAAVAIVGYAVMYSGLASLNHSISPSGGPVGVLDSLIPGRNRQNQSLPGTGGAAGGRPKKK